MCRSKNCQNQLIDIIVHARANNNLLGLHAGGGPEWPYYQFHKIASKCLGYI